VTDMNPGASPDSTARHTEPDAGPARPNQPTPNPTEFDLFLVEAARRRSRHTASDRPQDWCDPDPDVAKGMPEASHPVSRAVARQSTSRGKRDCISRFRVVCRRLQGADTSSVTNADVRAFPWHQITPDEAAEYRRDVYRRYHQQTTRNDYVCFLRSVVRQCHTAGLISPLRRDLLLEELYTVTPGRSTKRRRLTHDEVDALLEACETTGSHAARLRNTAMVSLMRTSGMRSCELVKVELADWDREQQTMLLRDTKNGRHHTIFVHPGAATYLNRWVAHRGNQPGALFTSLTGSSTRSLHTFSVRYMLKTRAEVAGVAPFGSHDFRRTFATELLRTHDHALVSRLLNHSKLSSTLVYDLADDDLQRAAVDTIQLFLEPLSDADSDPAGTEA
jgi:integrase